MTTGRMLFAGALVAMLAASAAAAGPVVDWDPAFFYSEDPGVAFNTAPALTELKIVGTVSAFGPPLDFLNVNMPATEYTFFITGLVSGGTATFGLPGSQFYVTPYTGGTITIYEDATPDAVFDPLPSANVPGTFTDGTPILIGTMSNFSTQTNDFTLHKTGNAEGHITWTGGSLISYVGGEQNPCPAIFTGGLTWFPGPLLPEGYLFRHDGKIDHECPTPTKSGTWGRIKTLYR